MEQPTQQVELPVGLSWWVLGDEGSESPALLILRQSLKGGVLVGTASRKGEACSVWERPFHNSNPVVPKHRLQGGELESSVVCLSGFSSVTLYRFKCISFYGYLYGRLVILIFIYDLDKNFSF